MNIKQGTTVASAVALMLGTAAGCSNEMASEEEVNANAQGLKCQGINECAAMSECAGAEGTNDCQGMNECAGMGWVTVESEEACTSEGGTIIS